MYSFISITYNTCLLTYIKRNIYKEIPTSNVLALLIMGKGRDDTDNSNYSSNLYSQIFKLINNSDLSSAKKTNILQEISAKISEKKTESFPLSTIVKYLKEDKNYNLSQIAKILSRNQRNLWHTYNSAQKKMSESFTIKEDDMYVPLKVFSDYTSLSPSEAVVFYLKEQRQLTLHKIATLLSRDDRTIWTINNRAKKKHAKT